MKKFLVVFLLLILTAGAVTGYVVYKPYSDDKNGKNQEDNEINFSVSEGEGYWTVAENMQSQGIIKSAKMFVKFMQKTYGSDFSYQAGTYIINSNMPFDELGKHMQEPDYKYISVTIPEGFRIVDIAERLQELGLCAKQDFINAQNNDDFDYDFISSIDNPEQRGYRLEGYLFPATYTIKEGTSAHDIIDEMLKTTDEYITSDIYAACKKLGISIDDALCMASILEKEAGGAPEEIKKVSSVFWNRLNNPYEFGTPTLGSDPTVQYADMLEDNGFSKAIWKSYSTYSTSGLPTGPICSPGLTAIQAAVSPETTDYYFFFTDKNGNFYYFQTNSEFQNKWNELVSQGKAG